MSGYPQILFTTALCAVLAGPLAARADTQVPPHPAKASPTTPMTRLPVAVTVLKNQGSSVAPLKPPVVTAVNPHRLGTTGEPVQLNTQPIPPGVGGPVDPPR
jgi:hypothetical protein